LHVTSCPNRCSLSYVFIVNIGRTVSFDKHQQIKITAWQTLVFHMFTITATTNLLDLQRAVRNVFDVEDLPAGNFRLYALQPGALIGAKRRVETEDEFNNLKNVYLNGDPKYAPPALYAWSTPENGGSPEKLPARVERSSIPSSNASSEGSQHSSSSRNSQVQQEFARSVLSRDGSRCVVCDSPENPQAAHVYNVERRPTRETLRRNGINGIFEAANGLTMCTTCHRLYDAHILCADPVTQRVVVAGAYLHWGDEKDKYATLVKSERVVRSSSPGWLPQALLQDRWEQYQQASERRRVQCDAYPEFCGRCWLRWKTKRGLEKHRCDKVEGKVEHLQHLRTPAKSSGEEVDECELDLAFRDLQLSGPEDWLP
jgi:hypothetical protein